MFDFIYYCCFGIRKSRLQKAYDVLDNLNDKEFTKIMNYYNKK